MSLDQETREERAEAKRRLVQDLLRACNRALHDGGLRPEDIVAELRLLAEGYAEGE